MKKFSCISLTIFILSAVLESCHQERHQTPAKRGQQSHQSYQSQDITLRKVLSIEDDGLDAGSIFFDIKGNIVYWRERDTTAIKFGIDGKEILRKSFRSGQGPGDINFFDFDSSDQDYFIYDKKYMRINALDQQMNLVRVITLREDMDLYNFRRDRQGRFYFVYESRTLDRQGWIQEVGLGRFSAGGKRMLVFFKASHRLYEFSEGRMISHFFGQPFLRYFVDSEEGIWVCDRRYYRIIHYGFDGKLLSTIEPACERIRIRGELEDRFRSFYRLDKLSDRNVIEATPEELNPVLEMIPVGPFILVLKARDQWKGSEMIPTDIYNKNGRLLKTIYLPNYYSCYSLGNQFKSSVSSWKDFIISLECDKSEERYWISLYKLDYGHLK